MQVRDLIEILKLHDQTMEIAVAESQEDEPAEILNVLTDDGLRRRLLIIVGDL